MTQVDREYNFAEVEASWATPIGTYNLKEGVSQDGALSEAKNSDAWALRADGQGNGLYTRLQDFTGLLTVTCEQESALNQKLQTAHNTDLLSGGVVGPILVTNKSNGDVDVYRNARIMGQPNRALSVSPTAVAWTFGYTRRDTKPGSPNQNAI